MLEIETEPLTEQPHSSSSRRPYENGDSPSHQQPNRFHLSPRWQKFLVALAIACIFMFFYNSETAEENIEGGVYTEKKNGTSPTSNTTSSYTGISNTDKDTTSTTGSSSTSTAAATTTVGITANVLEGEKLVQLVKQQREKFEAKLKQDYGEENFRNIFQYHNETTGQYLSRGRQAYGTPERISWSRMKRKLMIKILTAQIGMHTTRQRKRRQLLSLRENSNNNYRQRQLQQSSETDGYLAKFVWANGGHSSSAGHGNFYWESYTAVMERGIKPYFEALGIEFIGKNYAMGGTSSGEEIALCTDSVFGTDIDALTWDFGMTDAGQKEQWKQLLYTYHTAHGRNRPAAVGIEVSLDSTRTKIYDQMEEMGMITFYRDSKLYTAMQHSFPDTQGLNDAEINAMPPLVQKLKCGDGIEKGDPGCGVSCAVVFVD